MQKTFHFKVIEFYHPALQHLRDASAEHIIAMYALDNLYINPTIYAETGGDIEEARDKLLFNYQPVKVTYGSFNIIEI